MVSAARRIASLCVAAAGHVLESQINALRQLLDSQVEGHCRLLLQLDFRIGHGVGGRRRAAGVLGGILGWFLDACVLPLDFRSGSVSRFQVGELCGLFGLMFSPWLVILYLRGLPEHCCVARCRAMHTEYLPLF